MGYEWPGNVRELQNSIERAVILSSGQTLKISDFVLQSPSKNKGKKQDTLNLEVLEQETIEKAMSRSSGNMTKAAELLGITRYALYRKLKK